MSSRPPSVTNPYPGLRPFRIGEEHLFFGRERQIDAMVDLLAEQRFLAVLGSSGSGKSSLVNCGLVPALCRGTLTSAATGFRVVHLRPGRHPIAALSAALSAPGVLFRERNSNDVPLCDILEGSLRLSRAGLCDVYEQAHPREHRNLLVVADQFEELFRFADAGAGGEAGAGREDAAAFVQLLLEASRQRELPIFIVLTMRSDYLGECATFEGLVERINRSSYLVPRLTRDERRLAVGGPAMVAGAELDPVLVMRLVNDMGNDPDQLCALQHALRCSFEHWWKSGGRGKIGVSDYEAVGTMAQALDRHAENVFSSLSESQQELARRMFRALTDSVNDSRGIRRPLAWERLQRVLAATATELKPVLDLFRHPDQSFVMPPLDERLKADTTVDISHESLMRGWKRLDAWTKQEADAARLYGRLASDAASHAAGDTSLWREPQLSLGRRWWQRDRPNAHWARLYDGDFAEARSYLYRSFRAKLLRRGLLAASLVALLGTGATAVARARTAFEAQAERLSSDLVLAHKTVEARHSDQVRAHARAQLARTQADIREAERKRMQQKEEKAKLRLAEYYEKHPYMRPKAIETRKRHRELSWRLALAEEEATLLDVQVYGTRSQVIELGERLFRLALDLRYLSAALKVYPDAEAKVESRRSKQLQAKQRIDAELTGIETVNRNWKQQLLDVRILPIGATRMDVPALDPRFDLGTLELTAATPFPAGLAGPEWFVTRGLGDWHPSKDDSALKGALDARRRFAQSYADERKPAVLQTLQEILSHEPPDEPSLNELMGNVAELADDFRTRFPEKPAEQLVEPTQAERDKQHEEAELDELLRSKEARAYQGAGALERERKLLATETQQLQADNDRLEEQLGGAKARIVRLRGSLEAAQRDRKAVAKRLEEFESEQLSQYQLARNHLLALTELNAEVTFLDELGDALHGAIDGLKQDNATMRDFLKQHRR